MWKLGLDFKLFEILTEEPKIKRTFIILKKKQWKVKKSEINKSMKMIRKFHICFVLSIILIVDARDVLLRVSKRELPPEAETQDNSSDSNNVTNLLFGVLFGALSVPSIETLKPENRDPSKSNKKLLKNISKVYSQQLFSQYTSVGRNLPKLDFRSQDLLKIFHEILKSLRSL